MITLNKFSMDLNGNSIIRFSISNDNTNRIVILNNRTISVDKKSYGYSLQTNGNLPYTHNLKISGLKINDLSAIEIEMAIKEVKDFLLKYGTDKQKFLLTY